MGNEPKYAERQEVYWLSSGYGHKSRIPAMVLWYSKSGSRVLIDFRHARDGYRIQRYVKESALVEKERS